MDDKKTGRRSKQMDHLSPYGVFVAITCIVFGVIFAVLKLVWPLGAPYEIPKKPAQPATGEGSKDNAMAQGSIEGFFATAWKGGSANKTSPAGYGLKISCADRDRYFQSGWKTVSLKLPNGRVVEVNIDKDSFWNDTCRELINVEIGRWLLDDKLAPWVTGTPPKFLIVLSGNRAFDVYHQQIT